MSVLTEQYKFNNSHFFMKKAFLLLLFATVAFSCVPEQELVVDEPDFFDISSLSFNFTVNSPGDTKAVKSGWEYGDKVFVFFSGLSTGYVTFEYGTSGWNVPVVSGSGSIASGGTLTAVYLPFGNDDTPSHGASGWTFGQTYFSYYLVSESTAYTIDSAVSTLSAKMIMENPEDYVQFFVPDEDAVDGAYTLQSDAVIPVALASVGDDGIVTESKKNSSSAMPGYAYQGGYLFSGKLVPDTQYATEGVNGISFVGRYYFVKTKVSDGSREDYCTDVATLTGHFAAKLPANGSSKWIPVGPDQYVDLGGDVKWATCNLMCEKPEEQGPLFDPNTLGSMASSGAPSTIDLNSVTIPERSHGQWLIDNCVADTYMVRGQVGMVFKSTTTDGFIFLPCTHRNWGGDYVFGYNPSIDKWYPLEFDCRSTISVNLASTIGNSNTYTGTTIRPVKYKNSTPRFTDPFNSEVEI
jgi:hypothetical protein